MTNTLLIINVAILLEGFVEYSKSIYKLFEGGDKKEGITQICTIICGLVLAFVFKVNIFEILKIEVNTIAGYIMTGIIISRGSNYASDILSMLKKNTIKF